MEHCLTNLAPSVVESIFVKRVAVILMCDEVTTEEKLNAIKNEYARMCGMMDDDEETEQ
jgi:hypothetical protein